MPGRTPERPAAEALFREIPDTMLEETLTGAGTVNTIDLKDVGNGGVAGSGKNITGRWVYVTPKGGACYLRRYRDASGVSAPASASMQKGHRYEDGVTEEFWIDDRSGSKLAAEGTAAMKLVFEYGSRTGDAG